MSSRPSRGAARLAAILDALPDALVLVNCNGTVVNANTIALETLEAPGTALVGRGLLDLLPEFDSRLIPGSMRRPDSADERGRTKPTRMIARRTDRSEFPVEVTSANLSDGREADWSSPSQLGAVTGDQAYTGNELLMIVVRDLSGTVDTEAELARSQRQTEMILRAAAEGVVGTDTDGRVVLVNPAAAQILGFRASDLGGQELHPLVLHSRPDGEPFPYEESPLADTLRSGRKHRVRGQVLWAKNGSTVPVDMTTAPVRDGDQLVGAVMTFTDRRAYDALVTEHAEQTARTEKRHAEEIERAETRYTTDIAQAETRYTTDIAEAEKRYKALAESEKERYDALAASEQERYTALAESEQERYATLAETEKERYAALGEREKDRFEALAARHEQLLAVLAQSLRGPLDELRGELGTLAADPAGQLWPEANQVLHHLSAGYARMTTLVDNVLGYQRLDAGTDALDRKKVMLDEVVAAGVDGAVELIGPGRAQFAVHAPPIEAEVDPVRLATALAHLIADVAGIDATGNTRTTPQAAPGGYVDSTVVVAAAQRGEVIRIEVRGPYAGGDPVHEPIVRGIVRAHGGVLQTHAMPGMSGSAFVLDVPIGDGAGAVAHPALPAQGALGPGGSDEAAAADGAVGTGLAVAHVPGQQTEGHGRRRARRASVDSFLESGDTAEATAAPAKAPTGRRRGRRAADEPVAEQVAPQGAAELPAQGQAHGQVPAQTAGELPAAGAPGSAVQSAAAALPVPAQQADNMQRGRHDVRQDAASADGPANSGTGRRRGRPSPAEGAVVTAAEHAAGTAATASALGGTVPPQGVPVPSGRRARREGEQGGMAALPAGTGADSGAGQAPGSAVVLAPGVQGGPGAARDASAGSGSGADAQGADAQGAGAQGQRPSSGRRARRALAVAQERAAAQEPSGRTPFALPPAGTDRDQDGQGGQGGQGVMARHDVAAANPADDHTPPQAHPVQDPRTQPGPMTGPPQAAPPVGPQPSPDAHVAPQPAPGLAPDAPATPAQSTPGQGMPGEVAPQGMPPAPGAWGAPAAEQVPGAADVPGVPGVPDVPGAMPMPAPESEPTAGPQPGTASGLRPADASVEMPGRMPGQVPGQASAAGDAESQGSAAGVSRGTDASGVPAGPDGPDSGAAADAATGADTDTGGAATGAVPAEVPADAPAPAGSAGPLPGPLPWGSEDGEPEAPAAQPAPEPEPTPAPMPEQSTPGGGTPLPPGGGQPARAAQPLPAEAAPSDSGTTQGRAISVRTLGQGVPFVAPSSTHGRGAVPEVQRRQLQAPGAAAPTSQTPTPPPGQSSGSGRRRKLSTPAAKAENTATREQAAQPDAAQQAQPGQQAPQARQPQQAKQPPQGQSAPGAQTSQGQGRAYAIGAPDEGAEGPEPLDGPNGAVEVANQPQPQPMDDELPPEPLDNPRRLLVWPAPDVSTQAALSDRGYRPVVVHSREEVDSQIAAFPAALFVDPLTGPITRTALQSLRQAAVAAEVPVLVTAGLGQATREAAYGADPAVLLKALASRDSEQHPSRVLLIEEHEEIALALTSTLERRGMQVARASNDADAVTLASQMRPNLVVMDLMQVRRRRAGIVDWLRANGQLNRTPLVVYTAAVDQADLPRLAAGETVLFLAERSTSGEVQSRIVDLLARIGTN